MPLDQTSEPLLRVENLTTYFNITGGMLGNTTARVHAVEDISFQIMPGETLAMVGESGCGKSTTGRTLIGLEHATKGKISKELGEELKKVAVDTRDAFLRLREAS